LSVTEGFAAEGLFYASSGFDLPTCDSFLFGMTEFGRLVCIFSDKVFSVHSSAMHFCRQLQLRKIDPNLVNFCGLIGEKM